MSLQSAKLSEALKDGPVVVEVPEAAPAVDTADVRERLKRNRAALAGYFSSERGTIFRGLDAAALTRHHVFIGGPPGLAKSLIVETWAAQFQDAIYRRELLTRQTVEQDVLAFLDVPKFAKNGEYSYRHEGKLPEAHIAFVDECFKASGGLLNAMLTWLNERVARGGYASPLVTAVGASNELGEDDSVAALEDRFLVRFWLDKLSKDNRRAFLAGRAGGQTPPALEPVSLAELQACQAEVAALPVEEAVLDALAELSDTLAAVGVTVSDRRLGWCVEVLRAVAWLEGAPCVFADHIDFLQDVLWRRPEELPQVEAALAAVSRGIVGEIREIVERALAPYHDARRSMNDEQFARVAPSHLARLHQVARDIQGRFQGKVDAHVKSRAQAYLSELHAAFRDCKEAASKLSV